MPGKENQMNGWLYSWDPYQELERVHREINRLFSGNRGKIAEYPALNVWTNEDDAVVTAELPGVDPADISLSVVRDTLTLEGERTPLELAEGETFDRRERGFGRFSRTIRIPFEVESDGVKAQSRDGVLTITLPRKEATKPRKIAIHAS
jgi:HSP20 family protein